MNLMDDPDMADLVRRFDRSMQRAELDQIAKDPDAHALTRIMAQGKPASYRYYRTARKGIRYCYAVHRNAAGFFLTWRETVTREETRRDEWSAWKSKKSAIGAAKRNAGIGR